MRKGRKVLSFALALIATVGVLTGVKLSMPKASAKNNSTSEFFTATKNAKIIADYQIADEMGGYKGLFVQAPDNGESTITLNHELDLRAFTKEDALLSVVPVPTAPIEKLNGIQINSLIVRLTDVEDTEIFVEMKVQRNPDAVYPYAGYAQGRGSGQVMTGINYDSGTPKYYANGNYGRKVFANFYGRARSGVDVLAEIKPYSFAYDYQTSCVHTLSVADGYNNTIVADLRDSDKMSGVFKGFKSGKVTLSVTATSEGFNNKDTGFLITDFGGLDFSKSEWKDEQAPVLTVDTKGYEQNELPKAELFCPYPVFSAVAFDKFDGAIGNGSAEKTVEIDVRKAGGESVQMQNGFFTPTETGIYEIVYKATDGAENLAEIVLRVYTENPQDIAFAWAEELPETGIVGEKIVLPMGSASGVFGNYETNVKVLIDGQEIAIVNSGFVPQRAGVYEVQVTVKDFLGRESVFTYYVEVTAKKEPVLVSAPTIPVSFLKGKTATLPDFEAYDYYSLAGQKLDAEKYYLIKDENENTLKRVLPNEIFTVDESFGESVYVSYVAKSFLYETQIGGSQKVKIIDNSVMNFENSFVYENCTVVKDQETGKNTNISGDLGIAFLFEDDAAEIRLAKETLFSGMNLSFRVPKEANGYSKIILTVTDAKIASRKVVFTIEKSDAKDDANVDAEKNPFNYSNFYVNEQLAGQIWGNFSDSLVEDFQLKINTRGEIIDARGNLVCKVETYLTGEPFEGFSDNLCYLAFGFDGVSGESALQITNFNDQIIDPTDTEDYVGPAIQFTSSFKYEQPTGKIVLPGAVAVDFICGRVDVYVEIIMTSTYETVYLGKVGLDAFTVTLQKSGKYNVIYYAEDDSMQSTLDNVLHVYDTEPFTVTLQGEIKTSAKFGEKVVLPTFTVDDRLSSFDAVVFVLCPKGGLLDVTDGLSFTADQTGVYKAYYYVVYEMDNSYSYQLQEFEIEVK